MPTVLPEGRWIPGATPVLREPPFDASAVIFGFPFFLAAVWLGAALRSGWFEQLRCPPPASSVLVLASLLAGWGLFLWGEVVRDALGEAARRAKWRGEEGAPWRDDYRWDKGGIEDVVPRPARATLAAGASFALVAVLAHDWTGRWSASPWTFTFCALMCDVLAAACLAAGTYWLVRERKFGRSSLAFRRFPFFLGESLQVDFLASPEILLIPELVFTLRCVQERKVFPERPDPRLSTPLQTRCFELWSDVVAAKAPAFRVSLTIPLPSDANLGTNLGAPQPVSWQLEVLGAAKGIDFSARFLVPVYAAPSC